MNHQLETRMVRLVTSVVFSLAFTFITSWFGDLVFFSWFGFVGGRIGDSDYVHRFLVTFVACLDSVADFGSQEDFVQFRTI